MDELLYSDSSDSDLDQKNIEFSNLNGQQHPQQDIFKNDKDNTTISMNLGHHANLKNNNHDSDDDDDDDDDDDVLMSANTFASRVLKSPPLRPKLNNSPNLPIIPSLPPTLVTPPATPPISVHPPPLFQQHRRRKSSWAKPTLVSWKEASLEDLSSSPHNSKGKCLI